MRALASLVVVLVLVLGMYYFFLKRGQPAGTTSPAVQAVNLTGVQNDLLAIAQAERVYYAQHGAYASLSELTASGALTMTRLGRAGYSYSVETTATGFTVTARYADSATGSRFPTFLIDETMQIRQSD